MAIIWIIAILVLSAIYILISKKTEKLPLISLAIAGLIGTILLASSLGSNNIDAFFYGMIVFFLGLGLLITWSSYTMIDYDIEKKRYPQYYAMILVLISSLCAIVYFDNLIAVYVALEISAFLSAGLVMIKPSKVNFRAGVKYLFLSILASAFFLIGMVILFRLTNTFNISQMRELLELNYDYNLIRYSFVFIFIGIAFKSALFPFHIWLPDAYGSAPASSSAILSGIVSKAYIVLFIKLIYIGFGIDTVMDIKFLPIILILGAAGMIYGSLLAILQEDLQHRIAYSSVAQIGYIFMGIGLGNRLGLIAAAFHIIAHGITKSCLFLTEGTIVKKTGLRNTLDMDGIARSLPTTMALYTICSLSMMGIPLFAGFISKWNFAHAIMEVDSILLILILTLSSLLNGIYFLPLSIRSYFVIDESRERGLRLESKGNLPVIILGLLVIVTGVFSSPLMDFLNNIVERLI